MEKIKKGSCFIEKSKDVKEEIASFFENLYRREEFLRPNIDAISLPSIPVDHPSRLERDFEMEEIYSALVECDGDKAPGPDSFNSSFIKAGRHFLKDDFHEMHVEFHRRGRLNKELNATFLTLIPKFQILWS